MTQTGIYKDPEWAPKYRKRRKRERLEYQRKWRAQNPDKIKHYRLKFKYGISLEEYQAMVEARQSLCDLCDEYVENLSIDHCHETGKIRGLLCITCNLALGQLGDTIEGIKRVLQYLEKVYG